MRSEKAAFFHSIRIYRSLVGNTKETDTMIFISHRGESEDAPENTLPAFELSRERATSGMECDIHLTKDHVLVTIHDSSTERVSGREMIVEESTFAELQTLDVSNHKPAFCNTRIPKFSETLRYLGPGRLFYVEIKGDDPAVIDAMISELDAAKSRRNRS